MSPPLEGGPPGRGCAQAAAADRSSGPSDSQTIPNNQAPPYRSGGAATAAARAGWPDRTIDEISFVIAGLRQLGEADRRRARKVKLAPHDVLAAVVQGIAT